jgi:type IV secretory pathway VirB2 component (pilin)
MGVVFMTSSVTRPAVLISVLFLEIALLLGARRVAVLAGAALASTLVFWEGPWAGVAYPERAGAVWALVLGAWFSGLTRWGGVRSLTDRALQALGGAAGTVAAAAALRPSLWRSVELAVSDRMSVSLATLLDEVRKAQGGQAVPPSMVTLLNRTMQTLQGLFPATLAIASLAALGAAWWLFRRIAAGDDQGIRPLREFRFNDHMVWLFVGGLVLLVVRWGGLLGRVGMNAVVFMGALYALRGLAVVLFVSGGLSLIGVALLVLGLFFLGPVLFAGAVIIGLGDTWLDIRSRASAA